MTWIIVVLLIGVLVLGLAIWSIKRHKRSASRASNRDAPLVELMPSLSGLSWAWRSAATRWRFSRTARSSTLLEEISRRRGTRSISRPSSGRTGGSGGGWSTRCRSGPRRRQGALVLDAVGGKEMGEAARAQLRDAGCKFDDLPPAHAEEHRRADRARPPQAHRARRPYGLGRRSLHRRRMARRRAGRRARARPLACGFAARGARGAVGVQRELGRGDRASCSSARTFFPQLQPRRRGRGPRREHEARGLGAGRQDPSPPRHLLRARAALDPESVLPPRARRDRGLRPGGRARRRRARHGAVGRGVGHADRAACRASQLRAAARLGGADLRVSEDPAAPEGHDGRRRVVRDRLEQLRRPLVRDQRRDHARLPRPGARPAARGDLRARTAFTAPSCRRRNGKSAACCTARRTARSISSTKCCSYCGWMPSSCASLPQRSMSARITASNSRGVLPTGCSAACARRSRTSASASVSAVAACSR